MLRRIEVRLDHLFDCARCIAEIAILREINSAHAAAADPAHDLIATIQNCIRSELLYGRTMTTSRALSLMPVLPGARTLSVNEPPSEFEEIGRSPVDSVNLRRRRRYVFDD